MRRSRGSMCRGAAATHRIALNPHLDDVPHEAAPFPKHPPVLSQAAGEGRGLKRV